MLDLATQAYTPCTLYTHPMKLTEKATISLETSTKQLGCITRYRLSTLNHWIRHILNPYSGSALLMHCFNHAIAS
jgi:hypothetical protein